MFVHFISKILRKTRLNSARPSWVGTLALQSMRARAGVAVAVPRSAGSARQGRSLVRWSARQGTAMRLPFSPTSRVPRVPARRADHPTATSPYTRRAAPGLPLAVAPRTTLAPYCDPVDDWVTPCRRHDRLYKVATIFARGSQRCRRSQSRRPAIRGRAASSMFRLAWWPLECTAPFLIHHQSSSCHMLSRLCRQFAGEEPPTAAAAGLRRGRPPTRFPPWVSTQVGSLQPLEPPQPLPGRARWRGHRNFSRPRRPKPQGLHCKTPSSSRDFSAN
jgi:hypothetical protein